MLHKTPSPPSAGFLLFVETSESDPSIKKRISRRTSKKLSKTYNSQTLLETTLNMF